MTVLVGAEHEADLRMWTAQKPINLLQGQQVSVLLDLGYVAVQSTHNLLNCRLRKPLLKENKLWTYACDFHLLDALESLWAIDCGSNVWVFLPDHQIDGYIISLAINILQNFLSQLKRQVILLLSHHTLQTNLVLQTVQKFILSYWNLSLLRSETKLFKSFVFSEILCFFLLTPQLLQCIQEPSYCITIYLLAKCSRCASSDSL